jgi:hypothetical protein
VGVVASAGLWGGDETIRQASTCRHGVWRTMSNRAIFESKVVRLSPRHAAADDFWQASRRGGWPSREPCASTNCLDTSLTEG